MLGKKVRDDVGAFAKLHGIIIAPTLPKTRSGKILRGTIANISNKKEYKFPATIDDPKALDIIKNLTDKHLYP